MLVVRGVVAERVEEDFYDEDDALFVVRVKSG